MAPSNPFRWQKETDNSEGQIKGLLPRPAPGCSHLNTAALRPAAAQGHMLISWGKEEGTPMS